MCPKKQFWWVCRSHGISRALPRSTQTLGFISCIFPDPSKEIRNMPAAFLWWCCPIQNMLLITSRRRWSSQIRLKYPNEYLKPAVQGWVEPSSSTSLLWSGHATTEKSRKVPWQGQCFITDSDLCLHGNFIKEQLWDTDNKVLRRRIHTVGNFHFTSPCLPAIPTSGTTLRT